MCEPYRSNFQRLVDFSNSEIRQTILLLETMIKCNSRDNTIEKLKDVLRFRHIEKKRDPFWDKVHRQLKEIKDGIEENQRLIDENQRRWKEYLESPEHQEFLELREKLRSSASSMNSLAIREKTNKDE